MGFVFGWYQYLISIYWSGQPKSTIILTDYNNRNKATTGSALFSAHGIACTRLWRVSDQFFFSHLLGKRHARAFPASNNRCHVYLTCCSFFFFPSQPGLFMTRAIITDERDIPKQQNTIRRRDTRCVMQIGLWLEKRRSATVDLLHLKGDGKGNRLHAA